MYIRFTWDERKRRLNVRRHGFDFRDAPTVFGGPTYTIEDSRFAYDEQRFITLGLLRGIEVSTVHTESAQVIRAFRFGKPLAMKKPSSTRASRTDWARIRRMRDRDIQVSEEHPEAAVEHIVREIVRRGLRAVPPKASISLRLDADVLEWFKSQGRGYQTRMNAVLRAFKDASI